MSKVSLFNVGVNHLKNCLSKITFPSCNKKKQLVSFNRQFGTQRCNDHDFVHTQYYSQIVLDTFSGMIFYNDNMFLTNTFNRQ